MERSMGLIGSRWQWKVYLIRALDTTITGVYIGQGLIPDQSFGITIIR